MGNEISLHVYRGTEYLAQDTVDVELATFLELRSGALAVGIGTEPEGWYLEDESSQDL